MGLFIFILVVVLISYDVTRPGVGRKPWSQDLI